MRPGPSTEPSPPINSLPPLRCPPGRADMARLLVGELVALPLLWEALSVREGLNSKAGKLWREICCGLEGCRGRRALIVLSPTELVLDGDASLASWGGRIGKTKAGFGSGTRGVRGDARKTSVPMDSTEGEDMLCRWRGDETSAMICCAQNCPSYLAWID